MRSAYDFPFLGVSEFTLFLHCLRLFPPMETCRQCSCIVFRLPLGEKIPLNDLPSIGCSLSLISLGLWLRGDIRWERPAPLPQEDKVISWPASRLTPFLCSLGQRQGTTLQLQPFSAVWIAGTRPSLFPANFPLPPFSFFIQPFSPSPSWLRSLWETHPVSQHQFPPSFPAPPSFLWTFFLLPSFLASL